MRKLFTIIFYRDFLKVAATILLMLPAIVSMAQFPSNKVLISTSNSGEITVCGDTITFTIKVTNTTKTDSSATQVYVQALMPAGMEYLNGSIQGATYVSSVSNLLRSEYNNIGTQVTPNEPLFSLSDIPSGQTTTITYKATANCTLVPFLESSSNKQPVGIVNNTTVFFTLPSGKGSNAEPNGSESYNASFAELQMLVNNADKFETAVRLDQINRRLYIVNTGLGYVRDSIVGGNGISLTLNYDGNLSFIKALMASNNSNLHFTQTGNNVTVFVKDFSSIGNHNHLFELGDTIAITEYIQVTGCAPNVTTNYTVLWGCEGTSCNANDQNSQNASFVNVPNGTPNLQVTMLQMPSTDFCSNNTQGILQYTNIGSGTQPVKADAAIDINLFLSLSGFGNIAIKDSANNYVLVSSLGMSGGNVVFDNNSFFKTDIDGHNQGLADLDGDGYYDDLPVGQSIYIQVSPTVSSCPTSGFDLYVKTDGNFNNFCGRFFSSNNFSWESNLTIPETSSITGPLDVLDNQTVTFNFNLNTNYFNQGLLNTSNGKFVSTFIIPKVYTLNSIISSSAGSLNFTNINDTTYQVVGGNFNDIYQVSVTMTCDTTGKAPTSAASTFVWNMYYQTGNCSCQIPLVTNATYLVYNHCPNCPGWHTKSFNALRTTLGKVDPTTQGLYSYTIAQYDAAPKITSLTSGVRLDRALLYDTIQFVATGTLTAGTYSNVHIRVNYTYTAGASNPLTYLNSAYAMVNGVKCTLGAPTLTQAGSTYIYDFTVSSSCKGSSFTAGDEVDLYASYQVNTTTQGLSYGEYHFSNLRAEHYGISNTDTSSCESFGANLSVVSVLVQPFPTANQDNCGFWFQGMALLNKTFDNTFDNPFPNEFRPISHITQLTTVLPAGTHYEPQSTKFVLFNDAIHGFTASPVAEDPVITTINNGNGPQQQLSYTVQPDWSMGSEYSPYFTTTEWMQFTVVPNCDTIQIPTFNLNFNYTNYDYTYNSSLIAGNTTNITEFTEPVDNYHPSLTLSPDAIQEGYSRNVTWPVTICNSSPFPSYFTWLSFTPPGVPNQSNIHLNKAVDSFGNILPITSYNPHNSDAKLVELETAVNGNSCLTVNLTANYTNCVDNKLDTIQIATGWSCTNFPAYVSDTMCGIAKKSKLFLRYKTAALQPQFVRIDTTYDLCTPVPFKVNIFSAGFADLNNLKFWVGTYPGGPTLNTGSGTYTFPLNNPAPGVTVQTNTLPTATTITSSAGNGLGWNLSSILPNNDLNPFRGSREPDSNSVQINFTVNTSCGFDPGIPVKFFTQAVTNCGDTITLPFSQYKVKIKGVNPDSIKLKLTPGTFSACGSVGSYSLTATNLGAHPTQGGQWEVRFPKGISYVSSGSPTAIKDSLAPDSSTIVRWPMVGGINPGQSTSLSFNATITNFKLNGDTVKWDVRTFMSATAFCDATGKSCNLTVTTATDTVPQPILLVVPVIAINAPHDTLCAGNTETLSFSSQQSLTGYNNYQWSVNRVPVSGATNSYFNYTVASGTDTIGLTVSQNGQCVLSTSKIIIGKPVPNIVTVSGTTPASCPGSTDGSVNFSIATSPVAVSSIVLVGPAFTASGINISSSQTYQAGLSAGGYQFVVTYSNGCISNTGFTVGQGGPSVSLCAASLTCSKSPQPVNLYLVANRTIPQSGGTYKYQINKTGGGTVASGTGTFGDTSTIALSNVVANNQYTAQLIPDTIAGGNRCNATSNTVTLDSVVIAINGGGPYQRCIKENLVSVTISANLVTSSCTPSISAPFTFQLYMLDTTTKNYVAQGSPATVQQGANYVYNNLNDGSYKVVVTLGGGYNCQNTATFIVIPSSNDFTVELNTTNPICNGSNTGRAHLTVFGGIAPYSVTWYKNNNPADSLTPSNRMYQDSLYAGISYTVVVTDSRGCSHKGFSQTFTLQDAPALQKPQLSNTTGCHVTALEGGGGTAPYTFSWMHQAKVPVIVFDTTLQTFVVDTLLQFKTVWVDNNPASEGGGSYLSDPANNSSLVDMSGLYEVVVTDAKGCTATDTLAIKQPHVPRVYQLCIRYTTGADTIPKPPVIGDGQDAAPPDLIGEQMSDELNDQQSQCKATVAGIMNNVFQATCFNADSVNDAVTLNYSLHYYHFTLYYFDRAGRLMRTVPPKGVNPTYTSRTQGQALKHTMPTSYTNNSLGLMITENTPDAGITKYLYNNISQLRMSQNARQAAEGSYTYTKYDSLGRVVEAGKSTSGSFATLQSSLDNDGTVAVDLTTPISSSPLNSEQTVSFYSDSVKGINYFGRMGQQYLQNRVSHAYTINKDGRRVDTYYSYDPHGNVKWLAENIPGMGMNYSYYNYDLISNKVTEIKFNEFRKDRYYQRYSYDEDNRMTLVQTSKDNVIWENDATYKYYAHGPLKRLGLGEDLIQGMDYSYTVHGWLKSINDPTLKPSNDPGKDTTVNGKGYGTDVFGMMLGYYNGDFLGSGTPSQNTPSGTANLFNGNINSWASNVNGQGIGASGKYNDQLTAEVYSYDKLNRLTSSSISVNNSSTNDYATATSYDPNGNITKLTRNSYNADPIDLMGYHYTSGTNRLDYVNDSSVSANNGLENDLAKGQGSGNYMYDAQGRIIRDTQAKLSFQWNNYDKLVAVVPDQGVSKPVVQFAYNAQGQRVIKEVVSSRGTSYKDTSGNIANPANITATYYAREAGGNVLSIYGRTDKFSHSTIFFPCDTLPVDSAALKSIKYCYAGTIPANTFSCDTSKYHTKHILTSSNNTINADTMIIPAGTTFTAGFQFGNSGGVLVVCGTLNPQWFNMNPSNCKIVISSTGNVNLPYLNLNAGQEIDNFGSFTVSNPNISGTLNNYNILTVNGGIAINSGGRFTNYKTVTMTGDLNNTGTVTNNGSIITPTNLNNNTGATFNNGGLLKIGGIVQVNGGTVVNQCQLLVTGNITIGTTLRNFGYISSGNISTINGGGFLYLEAGSQLNTKTLMVNNQIINDSTKAGKCSILKVTGNTTINSGAKITGNISLCTGSVTDNTSGKGYLNGAGNNCNCTFGKPSCPGDTTKFFTANIVQQEIPIYGMERIGEYRPNLSLDSLSYTINNYTQVRADLDSTNYLTKDTSEVIVYRNAGDKDYELHDHLGNIRATVSDVKGVMLSSGSIVGLNAQVISYFNYYPGGMLQPLRSGNSNLYRYSYTGKEKDDEIYGVGNFIDFADRPFFTQILRWGNIDRLFEKYPMFSPYSYSNNNPILYKDFDGKDWGITIQQNPLTGQSTVVISATIYTARVNGMSPTGVPQQNANFVQVQNSAAVFQNLLNSANLTWTNPADGTVYPVVFQLTVLTPNQSITPNPNGRQPLQAEGSAQNDPIGNSFRSLPTTQANQNLMANRRVTGITNPVTGATNQVNGENLQTNVLSNGSGTAVTQDLQGFIQFFSTNPADQNTFIAPPATNPAAAPTLNPAAAQQFVNNMMQQGQAQRAAVATGAPAPPAPTGQRAPNSVNNTGGTIAP